MGSAQSQRLADANISGFYNKGFKMTEDQAVLATADQLANQMQVVIDFEYEKKLRCQPHAYLSFELNKVKPDDVLRMLQGDLSENFKLDWSTSNQLKHVHRFMLDYEKGERQPSDCEENCMFLLGLLSCQCLRKKIHIDSLMQVKTLLLAANSVDKLNLRSRYCNFGCCIVKTVTETSTVKQLAKMKLIMKAEQILSKTMDRRIHKVLNSTTVESLNEEIRQNTVEISSRENGLRLYIVEYTTKLSNISHGKVPVLHFSSAEEAEVYGLEMFYNNKNHIDTIVSFVSLGLSVTATRQRLKSGDKIMSNISSGKLIKDLYGVQLFVSADLLSELAYNISRAWSRTISLESVVFARVKSSFNKETSWLDFKLQVATSKGLVLEVQIVPIKNFLADMDVDGHRLHDLKLTMER